MSLEAKLTLPAGGAVIVAHESFMLRPFALSDFDSSKKGGGGGDVPAKSDSYIRTVSRLRKGAILLAGWSPLVRGRHQTGTQLQTVPTVPHTGVRAVGCMMLRRRKCRLSKNPLLISGDPRWPVDGTNAALQIHSKRVQVNGTVDLSGAAGLAADGTGIGGGGPTRR